MINEEVVPPEAKTLMTRIQRHHIDYIQTSLDLAQGFAADGYIEGVRRNVHDAVSRVRFVLSEDYPIKKDDFLENVVAEIHQVHNFAVKLPRSLEKDEILQNIEELKAMREQVAQRHAVPEPVHS